MSHSQDLLRALADELRPRYPSMPPSCLVAGDEPAGDLGIAHYRGFRPCATFTFDVGHPPSRKVGGHELWHAGHELAAGRLSGRPSPQGTMTGAAYILRPDDPVLIGFHSVMRYTETLETIITTADQWNEYISEHLAEAFGYLITNFRTASHGGMWARWGGNLNARLNDGSLDRFFRAQKPKEEEEAPEMEEARVRELVRDEMARAGVKTTDDAIKETFWRHAHDVPTIQTEGGDLAPAGETSTPKLL